MTDAILTLNAGSSSIKFALFARQAEIPRKPELVGQIDGIGAAAGASIGTQSRVGSKHRGVPRRARAISESAYDPQGASFGREDLRAGGGVPAD